LIEPYEYPVAGERRFITTQVAPIFFAGRCVGAAGLDIAVEEIPQATRAADADNPIETLLGCGFVFLAAGGAAGEIAYCSSRSRQLLTRFVGPMLGRELPARLRRMLDARVGTAPGISAAREIEARMGAAREIEARMGATREIDARMRAAREISARTCMDPRSHERQALVFRAGLRELSVRPFEHTATGPGLLLVERASQCQATRLSTREREVFAWLTQGKTNAEIATILGISLHTVKRHVEKVLSKLDLPNRSAAASAGMSMSGGLGIGLSTYTGTDQSPLAYSA
jgi:DNA-binding CsgD family transcriptional regulator